MQALQNIYKTRENFIRLLNSLDEEAINRIPYGFNNNIIWNFGHIIVTQQLICYKLSSLPMYVDTQMVESYRKGTKPQGIVSVEEIETFKQMALNTMGQMEEDLKQRRFQQFQPYTAKTFGIRLNNFEEAVGFNAIHEAMHLGYALALNKAVLRELQPSS